VRKKADHAVYAEAPEFLCRISCARYRIRCGCTGASHLFRLLDQGFFATGSWESQDPNLKGIKQAELIRRFIDAGLDAKEK
jgi:hypothetical protein